MPVYGFQKVNLNKNFLCLWFLFYIRDKHSAKPTSLSFLMKYYAITFTFDVQHSKIMKGTLYFIIL